MVYMADLITDSDLTTAIPILATKISSTERANLISAASRAIERECGRKLALGTYDEVYRPDRRTRRIYLKQYPTVSIASIGCMPSPVFTITNSDASNQSASVALTTSGDPLMPAIVGLTLSRVASGVIATPLTPIFATYATLGSIEAYIDSVGYGWYATTANGYSGWATTEIARDYGSFNAANGSTASLRIYTTTLDTYDLKPECGQVSMNDRWANVPWWGGTGEVRVRYTAGFATVPDDIKRACIMTVQNLIDVTVNSGVINSERIGDYSYTQASVLLPIPHAARMLMSTYQDRRFR